MCKPEIRKCLLKFLGANMVIFSPITIALAIADLVLTQKIWCDQLNECALATDLALTWTAVGIWAPIPIFFNGIGAIWIAGRPLAHNGWLCLLSFFNTVAFGPAIVIITALEINYSFTVNGGVQAVIDALPPPQNTNLGPGIKADFGIEVTIAVVGGVLFLHALAILYLNCCCMTCLHEEMAHNTGVPFYAGNEIYVESRKVPASAACQTRDPAQGDIDRLNLWSAYRWMNNGGAAAPAPVIRTNYYVVGSEQPGKSGKSDKAQHYVPPNQRDPGTLEGPAGDDWSGTSPTGLVFAQHSRAARRW